MNNLIISDVRQLNKYDIEIDKLLIDFYASIDVDKKTIRTYKKGIDNFIQWIKDNNITHIDKQVMLRYKDYLIDKYENTTANTYLSGVRNLFNFLEELGIPNLMRNIKGVKITKTFRKQALTKGQALKIRQDRASNLITLKDYRDYAIYNLSLLNGLREIELNRLDKTDLINIDGQFALKIQGKGKKDKGQLAILTDSALIPLLTYLDKRGDDEHTPMFIGLASNKYGTRLTTDSIGRVIRSMLVNNGYVSKVITPHSLRHTAITSALKGGADIQEAKELARHSDLNTTLIYAHNIDRVKNAPEFYVEKYLLGASDNKERG